MVRCSHSIFKHLFVLVFARQMSEMMSLAGVSTGCRDYGGFSYSKSFIPMEGFCFFVCLFLPRECFNFIKGKKIIELQSCIRP